MTKHRIYTTSVASVYPHYVTKAEKKGRTKSEVDEIIRWLTGYSQDALEAHFQGPNYNGMRAILGSFGLRGASVAKYRIDLEEPVYDATGSPRADFFTATA